MLEVVLLVKNGMSAILMAGGSIDCLYGTLFKVAATLFLVEISIGFTISMS